MYINTVDCVKVSCNLTLDAPQVVSLQYADDDFCTNWTEIESIMYEVIEIFYTLSVIYNVYF